MALNPSIAHSDEISSDPAFGKFYEAGLRRNLQLITADSLKTRRFIEYRCSNGHQFQVKRSTALSKRWAGHCGECHFQTRLKILKTIVASRGGKIRSRQTHFKSTDQIKLQCRAGHKFEKRVYALLEGTWCQACHLDSLKITEKKVLPDKTPLLDRLNEVALSRGGRCLTTDIKNQTQKAKFVCSKGHHFQSPASSILRNGAWCRPCSLQKRPGAFTLQDLIDYAHSHDGELLSTEYVRHADKYKWSCSEGHVFLRSWVAMRRGASFCIKCASGG